MPSLPGVGNGLAPLVLIDVQHGRLDARLDQLWDSWDLWWRNRRADRLGRLWVCQGLCGLPNEGLWIVQHMGRVGQRLRFWWTGRLERLWVCWGLCGLPNAGLLLVWHVGRM